MSKDLSPGIKNCLFCGKEIVMKIRRDLHRKKYCSTSCRSAYLSKTDPNRRINFEKAIKILEINIMNRHKDPNYYKNYQKTPEYKEKRRWRHIESRYGVTKDQWQEAFSVQEGECAICLIHQSELKRPLATDHCHSTGEFRGLLCDSCNLKLAIVEDIDFINKSTIYLNRSKIRMVK